MDANRLLSATLNRSEIISLRNLVVAGKKCRRLMQRKIEHLPVRDVEADEIWGFVGKKEGHKLPGD